MINFSTIFFLEFACLTENVVFLLVICQFIRSNFSSGYQLLLLPNSNPFLKHTYKDCVCLQIKSDPRVQAALETEALLKDPHDGFKKAVLLPLLELDPPKHSLFLLVDSIDEGQSLRAERRSQELRTIAGLLAEHHHLFPNWLLLVCTARRQSKTVAKMFSGFRKLCIDDLRKSQVIMKKNQKFRIDCENQTIRS